MDIHSIPESFQSKIRIAIISSLITGEKTFSQVKELTNATDGNLSVHMTKLEDIGYITVHKEFAGKKPRTTYSLTDKGKKDFVDYVSFLENLLRESK